MSDGNYGQDRICRIEYYSPIGFSLQNVRTLVCGSSCFLNGCIVTGGMIMSRRLHTNADRAVWILHIVQSTAQDWNNSVVDTMD